MTQALSFAAASALEPPLRKAELFLRWATLRNRHKRFGDALRLIDGAIAISEAENAESWIATALATRGMTYCESGRLSEAVAVLSEVLGGRRLTPRVEFSATGNLARAILGEEVLKGSPALEVPR